MSVSPDLERVGDLLPLVAGPSGPSSADRGKIPERRPEAPQGGGCPGDGGGGPSAHMTRLLAMVWPEVAGPEVAANARPVRFRQGRLVVSVSSSTWAQTLQLMSEAIASRLNERLGPGTVRQLIFRHAGWEAGPETRPEPREDGRPPGKRPPAVSAVKYEALSTEQEAALATIDTLDISPELRGKMKRTISAAFSRREEDFVR